MIRFCLLYFNQKTAYELRISDWSSDVCSSDLPETYAYAEDRRLFYVALTRASRGTFILCNRRKPSRYIRELCEIAGDDVRFEAVDGKELDQCPRCLVGSMVERQGRNNQTFYENGRSSCRERWCQSV